ncbi:hypothetical protein ACFQ1I_29440 [Kitasatospora arboriphila]
MDRIHRRAEGNPFFVEQLASAAREGCTAGIPDSLRDILLVRVETLPDHTQQILRIAAEGGTRVEHDLLAAVLDDPEEALIEALRTAVGAGVLRPDTDGDGYCFRHALVREAVSDDLLPGERHRINRRFAAVLEADPGLVRGEACAARLANYWYHAHEADRALPTALEAALQARRRNAFAEQLRMLERVLELWDEVPDGVRSTPVRPYDRTETYPSCGCTGEAHEPGCAGLQLVDVLAEAVVAARRSGDWDRAVTLVRRALDLLDEDTEPARAGWFRVQLAKTCGHLERPDGGEIQYAYRLVSGLGPSAVQAEVLAMEAAQGMLGHPDRSHMAVAEQAAGIAREVGADAVEQHARITLAGLYSEFGEPERAIALLTDAIGRARELGAADVLCRGLNNLSCLMQSLGRSAEALDRAREGLQVAGRTGLLGTAAAASPATWWRRSPPSAAAPRPPRPSTPGSTGRRSTRTTSSSTGSAASSASWRATWTPPRSSTGGPARRTSPASRRTSCPPRCSRCGSTPGRAGRSPPGRNCSPRSTSSSPPATRR